MNEKRLIVDENYNLVDTVTGEWLDDTQVFDLANKLAEENENITLLAQHNYEESKRIINRYVDKIKELENDYEYLEKKYKELARDYSEEEDAKIMWHTLYEKSQEECKELKRLVHLIHIDSMFSTVKSFNGDISERYVYSNQTDTIYDTANSYGQYDKILNNIEIVMLLNEYETMLNGDVE